MRTVSLRDQIVWPAISRMGFDPRVDLLTDMGEASARYINAWVRKCWDFADWPELSKVEPRNPVNHLVPYDAAVQPPPQYVQTVTYNKDQVVTDPNSLNVYISVINNNTGRQLTDVNAWALVQPWSKTNTYLPGNNTTPSLTPASLAVDTASGIVYVAQQAIIPSTVLSDSLRNPAAWLPVYTQTQAPQIQTNIGKVLKVFCVDPALNDGPFDIPFRELDTALHVGYFHGTTVWVKFMTRASQYTLTVWSSTTRYNQFSVTGSNTDMAYDPIVGECYASLGSNNINNPLPGTKGNNSSWAWVPFPLVLAEPVWRGLYSDTLRDNGFQAEAGAEEQAAIAELTLSMQRNIITRYDRLTDQQTGVPRYQSAVGAGAE